MNKKRQIILILIAFVLFGLSIGYATYSTDLSLSDLMASIRLKKDIRITGITVDSSGGNGISNYENYNVDSITSSLYLPNKDSYITYKVTITNFEGPEMGIYAITGLPENLEYSISNYELKDKICDENNNCSFGIIKDIYITIKYKNYDNSNTTYNVTLDFDFREFHSITYENIDSSLYPKEVLSGDKLEVNFGSNIVYCVIRDSKGNEILNDGSYYEFGNGKLIIYSVNDNLTINVSDTVPVPTLISTIKNLYLNAEKTIETRNGVPYYYAKSVYLMNDGLDSQGNVTNDETKGNIRYYGNNYDMSTHKYDVKNNIYFNCDDYSDTTTCETWNIIGIVDGKVKIIGPYIGGFNWDYNYNDNQILGSGYETDWNTSSLKDLLNDYYYYNIDTEYYNYCNSSTDDCGLGGIIRPPDDDLDDPFGSEDDPFGSEDEVTDESPQYAYDAWWYPSGITDATRDNNLISTSTWNINKIPSDNYGSISAYEFDPHAVYRAEQIGNSTWTGNIALADVSDAVYAEDWLWYLMEMSWFLSSKDDEYVYVNFETTRTQAVYPTAWNNMWMSTFNVRPVLYLSPELKVDSETNGSVSNPYRLIIE